MEARETSWETWNVPLVPVCTGPGILSICAVKGLEEAGPAHVVASQILLQPQRELLKPRLEALCYPSVSKAASPWCSSQRF